MKFTEEEQIRLISLKLYEEEHLYYYQQLSNLGFNKTQILKMANEEIRVLNRLFLSLKNIPQMRNIDGSLNRLNFLTILVRFFGFKADELFLLAFNYRRSFDSFFAFINPDNDDAALATYFLSRLLILNQAGFQSRHILSILNHPHGAYNLQELLKLTEYSQSESLVLIRQEIGVWLTRLDVLMGTGTTVEDIVACLTNTDISSFRILEKLYSQQITAPYGESSTSTMLLSEALTQLGFTNSQLIDVVLSEKAEQKLKVLTDLVSSFEINKFIKLQQDSINLVFHLLQNKGPEHLQFLIERLRAKTFRETMKQPAFFSKLCNLLEEYECTELSRISLVQIVKNCFAESPRLRSSAGVYASSYNQHGLLRTNHVVQEREDYHSSAIKHYSNIFSTQRF